MLSLTYRNTKDFRNPWCIKIVYSSLVGSILEFGSIIWINNYLSYINDINNI